MRGRPAVGLSLLLIIGLSDLTAGRVHAWRSDRALWTAAADVAPEKPRVALNLAAAALNARDPAEAGRWLDRAAVLAHARTGWERDYTVALVRANRAVQWAQEGRRTAACQHLWPPSPGDQEGPLVSARLGCPLDPRSAP